MQLTEQTGNTAISSVIAFNPTITRVEVGPGTYDEDATLAIPAGVTVVATAGPSQTFIRDINATGTGGDVTLATGAVLDGFTVSKGVTVNIYATIQNCVLSTTVAGGAVVNIAGGTGTTTLAVLIDNTFTVGAGQKGLLISAGQFATSTNDSFTVAATGTAISNLSAGSAGPPVVAGLALTGATVTGSSGTGLAVAAGTRTTVTGSAFNNLSAAIAVAAVNTLTVSNSTIDGCNKATTPTSGAIVISAAPTTAVAFTGNTITNSVDTIADGANGTGVRFNFNTFTGNTKTFTVAASVLNATNNYWGSASGPGGQYAQPP